MPINQWSTTAADNDDAATNVNWLENQAPSTVNNSARQMMADVAKWRDEMVGMVSNAFLTASVGSNALTIALKGDDGNDPSASNPVMVALRPHASATTVGQTLLTLTSAKSITAPAGATLGFGNSDTFNIYVYLGYDGTNSELAVTGVYPSVSDSNITNSTAIGTGSDSSSTLYGASGLSNAAFTLIGYINIQTGATAGNWSNAPLNVFGGSLEKIIRLASASDVSTGTSIGAILTPKALLDSGKYATTDTAQTLTNKTIALGNNTVSGTVAQFNAALTDGDFATLAGAETLTNKTLTSPVISDSIVFEGSTADAFEITLSVVDPTADRTVTLPNATIAVGGVIDRDVTAATISNSAAATTVCSFTVPANALSTNRMLRLTCHGKADNSTGSNQNVFIRTSFGGTALSFDTFTASSGVTRFYRILSEVVNLNATNAQWVGQTVWDGTTNQQQVASDSYTKDTTADQTLSVDVQLGTASTFLTFTLDAATLELV